MFKEAKDVATEFYWLYRMDETEEGADAPLFREENVLSRFSDWEEESKNE